MKKISYVFLFTACIILFLSFKTFIPSESNPLQKLTVTALPNNNITPNFLLGSLQSSTDANFSEVNELGLNMWHTYTSGKTSYQLGKNVPMGWIDSDSLTADSTTYISDVKGILTGINNNNGMRSLMQRPKIEYLCYGQRSD